MIKKIIKGIRIIILLLIALIIASTYIDYLRISNNKTPLFGIREYNNKTKIETYRGILYKSTRQVNDSEELNSYDETTYKILTKEIKIENKNVKEKLEYVLLNKLTPNCNEQSKLYYADKKIKVYTYCIDSLKIKESSKKNGIELTKYLEQKEDILENIKNKLSYVGLDDSKTIQVYKAQDEKFMNNKLVIYECNRENVNDIYIAPIDTTIKSDFCTYKDDDWEFLWKVEEKEYKNDSPFNPDTFYEDSEKVYKLTKTTKDQVFIVTPSVRGKPRTSTPLMDVIGTRNVTIEELKKRGLNYLEVDKDD